MSFLLRDARAWREGELVRCDVLIAKDRVAQVGAAGTLAGDREVELAGRVLLPGLVNAHDHLDFSTFPPLGHPPYRSVYEWAADVKAGQGTPEARAALAVPLPDRLFLGGLRNLLSGATAVAHHNPFHRSLQRADFPVRVLAKYGFAHSPGLTPNLRKTYRTTDRRIPWLVHLAEGTDDRCRRELDLLVEANVLRQNTVIVHGIALAPEAGPGLAKAGACVVWCPESNRHLYGATAPVAALRSAGVRIGLGSDSPASGVRDPLSNLAAARREGALDDAALLSLATHESAAVARLPAGAPEPGAPADFLVAEDIEGLLTGNRTAVQLVIVAGRARYGTAELMQGLAAASAGLRVDGAPRRLEGGLARRAARLVGSAAALRGVAWIQGLAFD